MFNYEHLRLLLRLILNVTKKAYLIEIVRQPRMNPVLYRVSAHYIHSTMQSVCRKQPYRHYLFVFAT